MATLGQIKAKVVERLKDPNNVEISASSVVTVINDAIEHWSKRRYWFNEFEETVALTEGNPALTLTTNTPIALFEEAGIVINYAQTRWILKPVSNYEYDAMNVQGQGIPFAYTERNGAYEVYYYPDAAYNAVVRGLKTYTDFATDGTQDNQSNDFTTNADNLIMYETLARLYGEIKQDPKMETYYAARAQNEHNSLIRQTHKRKRTGRIHVEGF